MVFPDPTYQIDYEVTVLFKYVNQFSMTQFNDFQP